MGLFKIFKNVIKLPISIVDDVIDIALDREPDKKLSETNTAVNLDNIVDEIERIVD